MVLLTDHRRRLSRRLCTARPRLTHAKRAAVICARSRDVRLSTFGGKVRVGRVVKAESVERKSIWGYSSRPSWFLQLSCTNPEAVRRAAVRRRLLPPRWRNARTMAGGPGRRGGRYVHPSLGRSG